MGIQPSIEALARWLADELRESGSTPREQALLRLRKRGVSELQALLVLAHALENGLLLRDPRALERVRVPSEGAPRSAVVARDRTPSVVVVEDEENVREAISLALEAEGYRVFAAGDGAEALRVLAQVPTPSMILLDLRMPVMDGWELLRRLKQDGRLAEVPVAVVSGATEDHPQEMRFVEKPINIVTLIETVEELRKSPHRRSA